MPTLIVDQFGSFIGKHSERIKVSQKGQTVSEMPLMDVEHLLVIAAGVSLSSDVIRECAERGIPVSFLSRSGKPYAKLLSPDLTGTVKTRREQLLAYNDQRGLHLGKCFAWGKVANQAVLLKYMAKYRKGTDAELYRTMRDATIEIDALKVQIQRLSGVDIDFLRPQLLNLEGRAARIYWDTAKALLGSDLAWEGREHRGAEDPVNMALNYGYGVLYTQAETAIVLAGLDPYAGFVHVDRAGKPSLVLDLVEEFRPSVVDRSVFALFNKGVELKVEDGRFVEASRRLLADRVLERLEGEEFYEGKKHKLRTIIQSQARHVATFVRGDGKYQPFVGRW
ncbi:MAG: CRISPR-associated endonuclease Cas1 [Chloroflexota bacterium]